MITLVSVIERRREREEIRLRSRIKTFVSITTTVDAEGVGKESFIFLSIEFGIIGWFRIDKRAVSSSSSSMKSSARVILSESFENI
jgi:hypothetical protein